MQNTKHVTWLGKGLAREFVKLIAVDWNGFVIPVLDWFQCYVLNIYRVVENATSKFFLSTPKINVLEICLKQNQSFNKCDVIKVFEID